MPGSFRLRGVCNLQAVVDELEATTRSAAQLMGLDDRLGTLEQGKLADVVVVEGDPYAFGDLTSRVREVWKAGVKVVKKS